MVMKYHRVFKLIVEKSNQYDGNSENEFIAFINECNLTYLKLFLQEPVEEKEIYNLIAKFEKNIENWDEMLYSFQKLFKLIDMEQIDVDIPDNIISSILTEIDTHTKDGVYKYSSSDVATFDSAYELLNIVTYFQKIHKVTNIGG